MRSLTLQLDDRLLDESEKRARQLGVTLEQYVGNLLARDIGSTSGSAFAAMLEVADSMGLRSEDGPLTREEAHERQ